MNALLLYVMAAAAAPAGYKVTAADVGGCETSLGPAAADGVVPMHAVCNWADVSIAKWNAVVSKLEHHDDIFGVVVSSEIRKPGAKALVYQLHRSKGISDREVLLWMWHESVGGADRYAWNTASAEALTPAEGNVRAPRSEGYWQAAANPSGGIKVEHHLEYDPGGSVPGFVVRAFQTGGLTANLTEMHAALLK